MKTVLIVDDDMPIGNMVEEVLQKEGYGTLRAYSGSEAVLLLEHTIPDLILLDLMLPGLSGEEVMTKTRGIPVIVMSAKADVADKVALLYGGAIDYVTKPFDTAELVARVAVALRDKHPPSTILSFQDIRLHTDTYEVYVGEEAVKLTRTEYAILKMLLQNPKQVIPKSRMLDRISEDTPDCTESSLKIHVSNLRKKLRGEDGKDYIESVWGIGFRLRSE